MQRLERAVGLAPEQIDHRKPARDLRARGTLQAMIDLMLQQRGRLVEQIDGNQPVGEPADHLVAAPTDRREVAKIIKQAERFDRRQRVRLAAEEQGVEQRRRFVLGAADQIGVGPCRQRRPHRRQCVAIAAILGVEAPEQLLRLQFGRVAAPGDGEAFEVLDCVGAADPAKPIAQDGRAQACLRGGGTVRPLHKPQPRRRCARVLRPCGP